MNKVQDIKLIFNWVNSTKNYFYILKYLIYLINNNKFEE